MLTSILRKPPHSKYFKTVYNYVDFDRFVAAYRIVILFLLVELRSCKLNSFFFLSYVGDNANNKFLERIDG